MDLFDGGISAGVRRCNYEAVVRASAGATSGGLRLGMASAISPGTAHQIPNMPTGLFTRARRSVNA